MKAVFFFQAQLAKCVPLSVSLQFSNINHKHKMLLSFYFFNLKVDNIMLFKPNKSENSLDALVQKVRGKINRIVNSVC